MKITAESFIITHDLQHIFLYNVIRKVDFIYFSRRIHYIAEQSVCVFRLSLELENSLKL